MTSLLLAGSRVRSRHRVLVVDDHPLMRQSIDDIVNCTADLVVCGEANSIDTALARVAELRPHLVVSDLALIGENGFNLVERLASAQPGLPVLILSMHSDGMHAERALRAGAAGYVMKGDKADVLLAAIREVIRGSVHFDPWVRDHAFRRLRQDIAGSRPPFTGLSPEELMVFEASARSEPEAALAMSLGLDAGQFRRRRQALCRKLSLSNETALRHFAWLWIDAGRPVL